MRTRYTPCIKSPGKDWKKHKSECTDTPTRPERNLRHTKSATWLCSVATISEHTAYRGSWTTRIKDPSKLRRSFPRSPSASHYPENGKFTMFSTSHCSNHTEPASTEHYWTPQKYSRRWTTSSRARNTMSKRLCHWSNVAEAIINEFSISSNGLTIRNEKTG